MKRKIFLVIGLCIIAVILITGCNNNYSGDKIIDNNIQNNNENEEQNIEIKNNIYNNDFNDELVPRKLLYNQNNNDNISIALGGDILMDSYFADYINKHGVDYSWTDISSIMSAADIAIVNLETSVSTRGSTKKREGYGFRSAPFTLEGLVNAGIDFVSAANNHILDYGENAFFDTMDYLDDYGISYAGIGSNIEEAEGVTIIEKNGLKIGFISYTSIIPWNNWRADDNSPGVAPLHDKDIKRALENIRDSNDKCDVLILILHWGVEYESTPLDSQVELAHQMIDAGADIIVGHHPHVLQGIEFYNKKPIFYSIGNFIFLKMNENAGKTCIFQVEVNKDGFVSGQLYPIHINRCKANLLTDEDDMKQEILNKMITLSKQFGTTIDENGKFILQGND